jgi:hypothetical protein
MRHKSADFNAAYMAKRPLAMCNQLTGCGKLTKCFIMKRELILEPQE